MQHCTILTPPRTDGIMTPAAKRMTFCRHSDSNFRKWWPVFFLTPPSSGVSDELVPISAWRLENFTDSTRVTTEMINTMASGPTNRMMFKTSALSSLKDESKTGVKKRAHHKFLVSL